MKPHPQLADQSNAPIIRKPLQMDHQHSRQLPEIKFLRGLHKILTLRTEPRVFLAQPLCLCEEREAVVETDFLWNLRDFLAALVILHRLW